MVVDNCYAQCPASYDEAVLLSHPINHFIRIYYQVFKIFDQLIDLWIISNIILTDLYQVLQLIDWCSR